MEKFEHTTSADIVKDNIENLKTLFPEAFTEGKIDFEVLKQMLGGEVEEREEKYGLNWYGKRLARQIALTPSTGTLRPCPGEGVDEETTKNIMIEGDNLEVLKLLQKSYSGKVKLIYIDPPYNTGRDFVYPDNFKDGVKNYLELTGQIEGEAKITNNPESSGRFHTDWLNMMLPRLMLARNLLTDDGVMIIHIDENEYPNLEKLLAEIFGENNNLGTIVWDKRNPKGDAAGVAQQHELICIYCKDRENFKAKNDFRRPKENANRMLEKAKQLIQKHGRITDQVRQEYKEWVSSQQQLSGGEKAYSEIDDNGDVFQPVSMAWPNKKKAPDDYLIPLNHPITGKPCPLPERGWRNPSSTMQELLASGQILFGNDETTQPRRKYLLKENIFESVPSILYFGGSDDALLSEFNIPFENPKPLYIAKKIIQVVCKGNDLVIDFFAGSSTSAHAVMQLNAEDSDTRRFIMVQLPEPIPENSEAQKYGFKTIADISRKRIVLAGQKIKSENPMFSGDTGFRVFKLDTSNIHTWEVDKNSLDRTLEDAMVHIKKDRSEEDILIELLLKLGLDLTVPVESQSIANKKVYSVGLGALIVCLDKSIKVTEVESLALGIIEWHKEIASESESSLVFRDSAFENDIAKTNLTAILEQHGLNNIRSL